MGRVASGVLALLLATGLLTTSGHAEKRVALVIGNANYNQERRASSLNDALLMAEVLRGRGFELVEGEALQYLDKRAFDRAIQLFADRLNGADVGLFYYAGHAINLNGTNYLIPVSLNPAARFGLRDETIDASAVLDRMQRAGPKFKLMFLDASHENPFGGSFGASSGLTRIDAPPDTIVSFAAQPGRFAVQPDRFGDQRGREQSAFTQALADAIRRPGLSAFDLFREVDQAVQGRSRGQQRPWVMINSGDAGRFSFDEPTAVAPAPAQTAIAAPSPPTAVPPVRSATPERAAAPPAQSAPPAQTASSPANRAKPAEPSRPQKQAKRQPPETKQAAVPKSSPPAAASGGRCRSIQALCALEIGGCCNSATGKWEYGRNGCGGSVMAHNTCISRKLAGQK